MARKTNKTAHVLNLISKAKDEHQAMEDQMQIDNTGSDVSNDLRFMGIEPSNDKSISEKITENLWAMAGQTEDASVKKTEPAQPPLEKEASASVEKPAAAPITSAETEISNDILPVQAPEISPAPAVSQESAEDLEMEAEIKHTFHYVNVYEKLVLERLEEFQALFDVCTCPRCTADVIALSLTHLPAKYIVIDDPKVIPLISFYREKLKTAVATQLSNACVTVKEHPLH